MTHPQGGFPQVSEETHARLATLRLVSQLPQLHDYVVRCLMAGTTWQEILDRLEAMMAD
jgi:hypothetical protein